MGIFKDHLITWVSEYLSHTHGEALALEIMEDIDYQYESPSENHFTALKWDI